MVMPGFCFSTSVMLAKCWSSICWRVTTLMLCGVSRIDRFILVAVLVTPVVYEPVPSVVAPSPTLFTCVADNSIAPVSSPAGMMK
ncbi:hypothetical protein D3C76_1332840 [compost metagenome]